MKGETKLFLGIIGVTLALIVGAVFFFSNNSGQPSTGAKVDSTILVRPDSEKISSESATVTLVEFSDYQCPACGAYFPLVKQIVSDFTGQMNFVYRNFPLSQHQNAQIAAQTAEAAGKQGKFWQMHDLLFEKQNDWAQTGNARDIFIGYAKTLGLDTDKLNKDIDSDVVKNMISRDIDDGTAAGVDATPSFFLDGEKLTNPTSIEDFRTIIKAAILKAPVTQKPAEAVYHVHANFKVIINDKAVDFTLAKYQGKDGKDLDENIHLHDGKGDLIHIHKKGITIGEFFKSLGMSLTKDCFSDDSGNKFCNDKSNSLKFLVNGKPNTQFDNFVPQDLDKLLVSYGNDNQTVIDTQLKSVADDACIYSDKCPDRGTPPTENCVGGLGTGCDTKP